MNDQRKVIFDQRLEILKQEDLSEIIKDMRQEVLLNILDNSIPNGTFVDDWDNERFEKDMDRLFSIKIPYKIGLRKMEWRRNILDKEFHLKLKMSIEKNK